MADEAVVVDIVANPRPFIDGMQQAVDSSASGGAAIDANLQRVIADTERAAKSARSSVDTLGNSASEFMKIGRQVDAALESNAKHLGDVTAKQQIYDTALKAGVMTQVEYASATENLAKQAAALKPATDSAATGAKGAASAVGELGSKSLVTGQQIGTMTGQLMRGDFTSFQQTLTSTGVRATALSGTLSVVTVTIGAMLAVVAGIGAVLYKSDQELDSFNKTLLVTGNYAGTTGLELAGLRTEIGESTGRYGAASEALTALAGSGRITGEQLQMAAEGAVAFAELTEQSADRAAAAFIRIAKDPSKAIDDLNQQYHFLTAEQFRHIENLEEEGRKTEAATEAMQLFADAMNTRFAEYREKQGFISRGWDDIKTSIAGAYAETKNFFQGMGSFSLDGAWTRFMAQAQNMAFGGQAAINFKAVFSDVTAGANTAAAATDGVSVAMEAAAIEGDKSIARIVERYGSAATSAERLKKIQNELYQSFLQGGELPKGLSLDMTSGSPQFSGPLWDEIAAKVNKATVAQKDATAASREHQKAMREVNTEIEQGVRVADQLAATYGGAFDGAIKSAGNTVRELEEALAALDKKSKIDKNFGMSSEYIKQWEQLLDALDKARERYDLVRAKAEALKQVQEASINPVDALLQRYREEEAAMQLGATARRDLELSIRAEKEAREAIVAAIKQSTDATGEEQKALVAMLPTLTEVAKRHAQVTEEMKRHQEAQRQWQQIVTSGFDSVASAIGQFAASGMKDWKSFGDSLVNTAKDFIAKIIAEMIKLKVFNGIVNSMFGTSLPTDMSAAFGGGGGGGSNWMSVISGFMGGGSGANANPPIGAVTGSTTGGGWMNTIASWFGGGSAATTGAGVIGAGAGTAATVAGANTVGTVAATGTTAATGGAMAGTMSWLAAAAPYIALIMWAVGQGDKWFKQGWDPNDPVNEELYDKGFMEAGMTGDIKGIGGNTLIDWTVLATDKILQNWFGMSENSAAMWSGSSGIMRAWGYKKPEVDWSEMDWNFDDEEGVTGLNTAHIKAKGGWFRSDKKWDETQELSEETRAQLELFWEKLAEDTEELANRYSLDASKAITDAAYTASFNGDGSSIASTSTINGRSYEGDTAEQFLSRVQSETFINLLSQVDEELSAAMEKYRSTAEELASATDIVLRINEDMTNGMVLLGTESDTTLSEVLKFVEGLQKAGESVADAYARIQAANAQYFQLVSGVDSQLAVFKQQTQTTSAVGAFADAMAGIDAEMNSTIKAMNAAAIAAGQQGARESDLARVHELAAIKAAGAIAQLMSVGQSLANQLYGSNPSLEQLNAQIAALQNNSVDAIGSLGGFGSAISEVSNRAREAIGILLGSLSPYNDQDKLQIALQGFRAGTVTEEQVLEIAQRLYASTQAYRDIFNEVHGRGRVPGSGREGGYSTSTGVSAGNSQELEALIAQRDALEASMRLQQARELAAVVATAAQAQQTTFEDIAEQLDFNLEDLAADLGMSQEELEKYLTELQSQKNAVPDSITSNFDRLIEFLANIFGVEVPENEGGAAEDNDPRNNPTRGRGDGSDGPIGYRPRNQRETGGGDENDPRNNPIRGRNVEVRDEETATAVADVKSAVNAGANSQVALLKDVRDGINRLINTIEQNMHDNPRNLR